MHTRTLFQNRQIFAFATICISTVALLGFFLNFRGASLQTFLIYFVSQFVVYGLARAVAPDIGYELGAIFGICVTTGTHAMWELSWYKGPNSMPFFVYLFFVVPSLVVGLLIAGYFASKFKKPRHWFSALFTSACLLPFAVYFVVFAP